MAESLVRLLDALPEPIIPFSLYQRCVDSYQTYQLAKQATSQIPTVHYNVFVYLTAFLREVYSHANKNGLEGENLGISIYSYLFGPLISLVGWVGFLFICTNVFPFSFISVDLFLGDSPIPEDRL